MTKISIKLGDITEENVDCIVNAANKSLLGGGGIDGAIHRSSGSELYKECKTLGGCRTGEAKITKGYNLLAKFVIHTVGPIYGHENNKDAELLSNCYLNSLNMAKEKNLKSIAFPAISTGAFGYPKEEAAKIAVQSVKKFISENTDAFSEIIFVLYNELNYNIYKAVENGKNFEIKLKKLK